MALKSVTLVVMVDTEAILWYDKDFEEVDIEFGVVTEAYRSEPVRDVVDLGLDGLDVGGDVGVVVNH